MREVEDVFVGAGGDGTPCEQDQSRCGKSLVGEPALKQRERACGGFVGVCDQVVLGVCDEGNEDEVRQRRAVVERAP